MATEITTKARLRRLAVNEVKEFAILAAYLYVTLGAVIMYKSAVLHLYGISFTPWGIAVVKAALLAKFMMLGSAMHLGERDKGRPLIWPTLQNALGLLVLLVLLTVGEEVVVGLFHHEAVAVSLGRLAGAKLGESLASIVILLLVLLPYSAIQALGKALGAGKLAKMFFSERGPRL